ncbi:MAG TPA: Rrf2 family transcriptional regulator [bacterium]|nr:MAG: HTH-type transcriptional regulator CymR [Parcubacteria group bacterium ADurb.Bin192]HPN14660.1 Rrf2 family transcriptional regulator [bacterium]
MPNSLFRVSARNHAGMILMTQIAALGTGPVKSLPGVDYVSLKEVSERMGLSQGFLEEIATLLKKAGLIKARKGPGGGYRLSRPANKITAEQILVALEGPINLVECHGGACPVAELCSSKALWNFLQQDILKSLKKTTLDKMLD